MRYTLNLSFVTERHRKKQTYKQDRAVFVKYIKKLPRSKQDRVWGSVYGVAHLVAMLDWRSMDKTLTAQRSERYWQSTWLPPPPTISTSTVTPSITPYSQSTDNPRPLLLLSNKIYPYFPYWSPTVPTFFFNVLRRIKAGASKGLQELPPLVPMSTYLYEDSRGRDHGYIIPNVYAFIKVKEVKKKRWGFPCISINIV